jgi:hypothetical protein
VAAAAPSANRDPAGVALEELLAGSVVALEERHAAAIYSLIVCGWLPARLPPAFAHVPTRGEFPEGTEGVVAFKVAAFRFVQREVLGKAGPRARARR